MLIYFTLNKMFERLKWYPYLSSFWKFHGGDSAESFVSQFSTWLYAHAATYMPYLTLWDKISQNLAHLEANSHKIFQISQNFQTILQILWRNKHKSHFVVFITSFLHLNKGFWLFWGSSKVFFVKISQFYQISLKNLPYLTDFSPQLMACMLQSQENFHGGDFLNGRRHFIVTFY